MNNASEGPATAAVPVAARLPSAGDALRRPTNNGRLSTEDVDVERRFILGPQRQISSVSASDEIETKAEEMNRCSDACFLLLFF